MLNGLRPVGQPLSEHLPQVQTTQPLVPVTDALPPEKPDAAPEVVTTDVHSTSTSQHATQAPVSKTLSDLPVAELPDVLSYFKTFGTTAATNVVRSGDHLVIATMDQNRALQAVKIPLVTLDTAMQGGHIEAKSPLVQSLKVFEAAYNAGLPPSAANAIVRGFRAKLDQGVPAKEAMLASLTNIAVASQVEAYVNNKSGLASDMRRIADFTKEAFDGNTAGGSLQALKNRTLRAEVIKQAQGHLDGKLHAFTDAFATARENGDYDKAFDTLQKFFSASAHVTETDYWRKRPETLASALQTSRPPGPIDGAPPLTISEAIEKAPDVAPKTLTLPTAQPAAKSSIKGWISETASAVWQWIKGNAATVSGSRADGAAAAFAQLQAKGGNPVAITGCVYRAPGSASPTPARPLFSPAYLQRFTSPQRQAIMALELTFTNQTKPPATADERNAFADKLSAAVDAVKATGVHKDEALAMRAQLERRHVATMNPELAPVLGNTSYDVAKDPTTGPLGPVDMKRFLMRIDMQGVIVPDLKRNLDYLIQSNPKVKAEIVKSVADAERASGKPLGFAERDAIATEMTKTALTKGWVTADQLIADLKASSPQLLKEAWRGFDLDKLPSDLKAKVKAGDPAAFDDATMKQLFETTIGPSGPVTVLDKLARPGAHGTGAGGGSDEASSNQQYASLTDSDIRMKHRVEIFKGLAAKVNDPVGLKAEIDMQQKGLEGDLQAARQALRSAKAAYDTAKAGGDKSGKAKANFQKLRHAQQVKKLQRQIHDLKTVGTTVMEAAKSGKPADHPGFKVFQGISTMSPLERFAIVAYTSNLYSVANSPLRFDLMGINGTDRKELLNWTKTMQSALNKLPPYTGFTFRQDSSSDRYNLLQTGNEVGDKAFSSTASEISGTVGAQNKGVLSISKVTNGKVIADLSHYGSGEREVLMPPFSTFEVESRLELPTGKQWSDFLSQPENVKLLKDFGVDPAEVRNNLDSSTKTIILQRQV
jgi:hypothetical protein